MSTSTAERVTTKTYAGVGEIKNAEQGTFEAVFSTFNIIDADGDVVKPGAIPEVEVPIVWGHDWGMMPVGKGNIRVTRKNAIVEGRFNLATQQGREAWETLKFMGPSQQYSWGFEITEHSFGEHEGRQVRFITGTRPFEVSPVLVGSNPETGTIRVKALCPTCGQRPAAGEEPSEPPTVEGEGEQAPVEEVGADWQERGRIRIARQKYGVADCDG